MRNKILTALCATVMILSGYSFCEAQFISNKINIYAGYETGGFHGNKTIHENNFIYPSLYPNFNTLDGISLKVRYNYNLHLSFGIAFSYLQASNWEYPDSMLYQGSEVTLQSLSADIQLHTKLSETGIWNRIRLLLEISPTFGISRLSLTNLLFDIQQGNNSISQPKGSNDLYYGLKGTLGVEVTLNQVTSVFFDYSYGYYLVSSNLYSDNHFTNYIIEAGIVIKLRKNKRYFY